MSNKQVVMGQTGKVVLSDDKIQYKLARKRTVRYNFMRVKYGWICIVLGPFHSATYGVCAFGTKKKTAKATLQRRLANDYRYIGKMLFSVVDEADNVGKVDNRVLSDCAQSPISICDAVGTAGV